MDEQKVPYIVFEGATLRQEGFSRKTLPDTCPDCYNALDFCEDHPKGTYVLGFGGHVATVVDGDLYDRGRYSMDGYYYDDGMSHRRGRAANGRFVSRDGSEMARKLREMMADAPDDASRQEIQRLAERMEQM